MAVFVINEWLWADSSGENGLPAQRDTFKLITQLALSQHQIVFIEGSPFDQKAWNLCKSKNAIVGAIAKAFVLSVRQDSDHCLILKPGDVSPLPEDLATATKPGDHYLLQTMLHVRDAILVTTDEPLRVVGSKAGLTCLSREEFLSTYF